MAIETIHLSQQAKDQLVKLKRITGIQNWDVLCRWGLCLSFADDSIPAYSKIPADSSVEMTWKVFGGENREIYYALLKERCQKDGTDLTDEAITNQFRLHLHRGIGFLSTLKKNDGIEAVFSTASSNDRP